MTFSNSALILIDIQNDFCPGGALAVPEGDQVVAPANRLMPLFDAILAGRDWHPADHCSFRSQGGTWPPHCVAGTAGAAYHPDLDQSRITHHLVKADTRGPDCYSEFGGHDDQGRTFDDLLQTLRIDTLYVTGLATDYCVRATVLDAVQNGYAVRVVRDAVRAVDVKPGDGDRALAEMERAGAQLVTSRELLS